MEQSSTSKILDGMDEGTKYLTPIFGSESSDAQMPRLKMNDNPVEPRIAYEMIKEYLSIEGNATQNLTTFCQTYMEPMATKIMAETMEKNAIDKDEYPMTADLENRCVAMIGDLWHANPDEEPMGTSTVGSSEACMLGGLGMLFRWKKLAKDAGIDIYTSQRPNLVISAGYQVCWEKFCRYWDIEMRLVPLEKDHLSLNMDTVMDYVDDHTIGITAILGITYTGKFDDVKKLDELVEAYNQEHPKLPIRIHVDGASGGMFAPFVEPDLVWDFQLKNVWSINCSGHKYGLVYPGIGWVVWRSKEALPEDLIFWVSYLGGEEATMAINFSRSASQIVGQYYVLMRNGFQGFKEIQERTLDVARYLALELDEMGIFEIYEDASHIPIVCWGLKVRRERGVVALRPVRPPAHERLAGARVPDACRHAGHHGATCRGPRRLLHAAGHQAGRGHEEGDRHPEQGQVRHRQHPGRHPHRLQPWRTRRSQQRRQGADEGPHARR